MIPSLLSAGERISATTTLLWSWLPGVTVSTPPLFTLSGWPCWQAVTQKSIPWFSPAELNRKTPLFSEFPSNFSSLCSLSVSSLPVLFYLITRQENTSHVNFFLNNKNNADIFKNLSGRNNLRLQGWHLLIVTKHTLSGINYPFFLFKCDPDAAHVSLHWFWLKETGENIPHVALFPFIHVIKCTEGHLGANSR